MRAAARGRRARAVRPLADPRGHRLVLHRRRPARAGAHPGTQPVRARRDHGLADGQPGGPLAPAARPRRRAHRGRQRTLAPTRHRPRCAQPRRGHGANPRRAGRAHPAAGRHRHRARGRRRRGGRGRHRLRRPDRAEPAAAARRRPAGRIARAVAGGGGGPAARRGHRRPPGAAGSAARIGAPPRRAYGLARRAGPGRCWRAGSRRERDRPGCRKGPCRRPRDPARHLIHGRAGHADRAVRTERRGQDDAAAGARGPAARRTGRTRSTPGRLPAARSAQRLGPHHRRGRGARAYSAPGCGDRAR